MLVFSFMTLALLYVPAPLLLRSPYKFHSLGHKNKSPFGRLVFYDTRSFICRDTQNRTEVLRSQTARTTIMLYPEESPGDFARFMKQSGRLFYPVQYILQLQTISRQNNTTPTQKCECYTYQHGTLVHSRFSGGSIGRS